MAPSRPPHLKDAASVVTDRNVGRVLRALRDVELPSPAFALCLLPSDESDDLVPTHLQIGVEEDRARVVGSLSPFEALHYVWSPAYLSYGPLEVEAPGSDAAFAEAAGRLLPWLAEHDDVLDPTVWLLEEVAAHLTRQRPPIPVTDDFLAYVPIEADDLLASLRWIAPPAVQTMLAQKGLLVDDPDQLEGAPDYGWGDEEA
jgi:hypothetical protein